MKIINRTIKENVTFSIVTVCFNAENDIEETIRSVIGQNFKDYEYVVIDGNSTDNTTNIIRKYENKLDVFLSEENHGVYNAMNKGIKCSKGDYIYFLNAGDRFLHDEVLTLINNAINRLKMPKLFLGSVIRFSTRTGFTKKITYHFKKLDLIGIIEKTLNHQAIFVSKDTFQSIGLFREDLKIKADHEWFIRMFCSDNQRLYYEDIVISLYKDEGLSSSNYSLNRDEKRQMISNLFSKTEKSIKHIKYYYDNKWFRKFLNFGTYHIPFLRKKIINYLLNHRIYKDEFKQLLKTRQT